MQLIYNAESSIGVSRVCKVQKPFIAKNRGNMV